jgi:protein-S-isoprenylcysteine O-methyltransferase Ste14
VRLPICLPIHLPHHLPNRPPDGNGPVSPYGWLTFGPWLALVIYWVQASIRKRGVGDAWDWRREIALRLGFFALLLFLLRTAIAVHVVPETPPHVFNTGTLTGLTGLTGLIGLVICALGIGLAILGRAWLTRARPVRARLTDDSDALVTTGPYTWVRHPIYGGMLLAMVGSAIAQSMLWILPLVLYGPALISGARREERRLSEQFPERYRAYMKRTRMLLPFLI